MNQQTGSGVVGCKRGLAVAGVVSALLIGGSAGCTPGRNAVWIGANTSLGEAAVSTAPAGPAGARGVSMVSELGIPLVRDSVMNWGLLQPRADRPIDFAKSDSAVRTLQATGAGLLVVFRGIPGWATETPNLVAIDPGLPPRQQAAAFDAFVQKYVERYDGDGRSDMPGLRGKVEGYQFMSEMEDIPTAEYAYWLKLFCQAVKAADPQAVVVLGGLKSPGIRIFNGPSGDYARYLEHLLAEDELAGPGYPYFDVAAFHNFPGQYPGRPAYDDAVAYIRQTLADHKLSLPVWLTSTGAAGTPKEEAGQADSLVKWLLKVRTIGVDRVYLARLCDGPGPGPVPEAGLARVGGRGELACKPAFGAIARLLQQTRDRPEVRLRNEGVYTLTGSDTVYVIWKEESYDPAKLLIPGWWFVENPGGARVLREGSDIRLTSSPIFIQRTTSPFIR
jgi:hypothetical protein